MSNVYFTSDWHLGHRNILKYRNVFKTIEHHDWTLFSNYLTKIKKRDTVYFGGDIAFTEESLELLKNLPGTKILIMGNHDGLPAKKYLEVFDDISGPMKYKGVWVSHIPIHPQELYDKPNVHGHTHNQNVLKFDGRLNTMLLDSRYYNMCPEWNNYSPVPFEHIKRFFHNSKEQFQ